MKNLGYVFSAVTLLTLFITFCNQKEEFNSLPSGKSLESILTEISTKATSENKIVKFTLLVYKGSINTYGFENVEFLENSQDILDFNKGAQNAIAQKISDKKYLVDCTDTQGNTKSTSCNDYKCVGYYVALCVESGGCATVCKVDLTVAP